jgi:hypothetical protein
VRELAGGAPSLTDEEKGALTARMERFAPGAGLSFLIGLGADAAARELATSPSSPSATPPHTP